MDGKTKESSAAPPEADFSLFDVEEQVLADTARMIQQLHDIVNGVQKLSEAYSRSYREQQRLVRLSDRMQQDLQSARNELLKQADDLRAFNQSLSGEVRERTKLADVLYRMATRDPLTGALTRRHLFDFGGHEFSKRSQVGGELVALMIDLDEFKQINDVHGHHAGDAALKNFADIVTAVIRSTDIFARYGGDEFVILLLDTGGPAGRNVAERLRLAVAEAGGWPVRDMTVTVTIGMAVARDEDLILENLLDRADGALYAAKRAGRNCFVIASPEKTPSDEDPA
jgi:diguanylate cyclase (GGDEF)-like protein